MKKAQSLILAVLALSITPEAFGQAMYIDHARVTPEDTANVRILNLSELDFDSELDTIAEADTSLVSLEDTIAPQWPLLTDYPNVDFYMLATREMAYDTVVSMKPLPRTFFRPAVFNNYTFERDIDPFTADYSGNSALRWVEEAQAQANIIERMQRYLFYTHPEQVVYNINLLPEAPKRYIATVNPEEHTIEINELSDVKAVSSTIRASEVKRRHWLSTFNASLQFSQAYVSPNWYQGGNNNLNAIGQLIYNVKLNQSYHPDLLFETTISYKLGLNNAPDDEVHDYNISDDIFQVNSTFGLKAARRWYYSVNLMFKTQMFDSYKKNSDDLRAAFMSPGELNVGLGMTYNYANKPKNFNFDASLAPLSYNLKTCINSKMNETAYEIEEGKNARHKFGSSAELKVKWVLCRNVTYNARLFAFTDYGQAYADWENTFNFEINRYLSSRIYVHLRYDTNTPACDDPDWHKLQVKEIFSIGFSYKFSSI